MAYTANELYTAGQTVPANLRVIADHILPKTFANSSGAELLPLLTPLIFNETTSKWQVWLYETDTEHSILGAAATPATAGNFTLTVNGVVTGNIAYNADAAAVKQAIVAVGIGDSDDITTVMVTGANLGVGGAQLRIIWGGEMAGTNPAVSIQTGGLTGNPHSLAVEFAEGVAGGHDIKGFVWPDPVQLDVTNDVIGQVLMAGTLHYADIALPADQTANGLKAALRNPKVRFAGFTIQGLDGIH